MKKLIALILCFLLIFSVTVSAEFQTMPGDAETDEFVISDSSVSGKTAVLFVLDTDKSIEELKSGDIGEFIITEDVIYADSFKITDGSYVFRFTVTGNGSEEYKAIVTIDDEISEIQEFSFYPKSEKLALMASLSGKNITADDVTKVVSLFSLKSYVPADIAEAAKILQNLEAEENTFSGTDINKCRDMIIRSLIISDLNKGTHILYEDGIFKYANEMHIISLPEWKDYTENLNSDGVNAVKAGLKNIMDYSDFKQKFSELIAVNVLTNYKSLGSGHVAQYLDKYKSLYATAGFKLSSLGFVADTATVYGDVSESDKTSLSELAEVFNSALMNSSSQSPAAGGGSVKKPGSGGGGGGLGYIPPETSNSEGIPPVSDNDIYSDVGTGHWAYSYIDTLSKAGIINGKGKGIYAPDDNVKRGEFAKMMVLASGLTPNDNACKFADTFGSWSKPYVGAAVEAGFVSGIDENSFKPENELTREEAATIIGRALNVELKADVALFDDDSNISEWAKKYVYALREAGIISGRGDNRFDSRATLTRAEAAKLIALVYESLR